MIVASNQPKYRKLRKRKRPIQKKTSVMRQIPGCMGIWSLLAARLKTTLNTLRRTLEQEGWEHVLEAFKEEKALTNDRNVLNIQCLADYSPDPNIRYKAGTYMLDKLHPDFHPKSTVVHEGGDNPIQHQHKLVIFDYNAEILKRPVEERLEALELAEAKEKELNED